MLFTGKLGANCYLSVKMKKLLIILTTGFLLPACATQPEVKEWTLTYVGSFSSVRGVKDPLSCFCPNGGYVDACGGKRVPLCFEGKGPPEDCRSIEVQGSYVDGVPGPDWAGHCPDEPMRYLLVEEWHCRD